MESTLIIAASAPVPRGNRVEITQSRADGAVTAIRDLDRGILRLLRELPHDQTEVWRGLVRECTVADTANGPRTTLVVATSDAAGAAEHALAEADAAAEAARAESRRWGGADREPMKEPDRFW